MKFSISRDHLLRALTLVSGAVERRHTVPVLSNVKLELDSRQLVLTASDLEVELQVSLPMTAAAVQEAGETTVSSRKLMDICKSLPNASLIQLETIAEQRCRVCSGRVDFELGTLPATDFPALGAPTGVAELRVSPKSLRTVLDQTAFAMAVQDVRFYLTGLLLEASEGKLRGVATDGHRLALVDEAGTLSGSQELQAIVPRKAVMELQRLLSAEDETNLTLSLGRELMQVELALPLQPKDKQEGEGTLIGLRFTSKLIDGKYPDYKRVLPRQGKHIIQVPVEDFRQSLQRVAIMSNEKLRGVFLEFKPGTLVLRANNPEQDRASEDMAIDYQGETLEMSFNAQYLLDVCQVLPGDTLQFSISEANSSALLQVPESDQALFVVMPMRV